MPPCPASGPIDESRPTRQRRATRQKPLQIVRQRLRRGIPIVARLGHRREHDRLQIDRHGRIESSRRRRLVVLDLPHHRVPIVAGKRVPLRDQFVKRDAERIDIGPRVDRPALPEACSGLMYRSVPTTSPVSVTPLSF